jgi:truncated hemoglobin YjbI/ankyrin repeat protein
MEHRRFLTHPEAHRPFMGGKLFSHVGGRETVDALIDGLYDRIEADPALRPLFGRHLRNERDGQKRFFAEWLGGGGVYSERANLPLKHRHDLLPITPILAERWLTHFCGSLDLTVSDALARQAIYEQVRLLAMALVNEGEPQSAMRARPHGTCLRYEPAIESLALVRHGDVAGLSALLERAPEVLTSVTHAASLVHLAVLAGRVNIVRLLLDSGVDVNKPAAILPLIYVTPLCAARARQRKGTEELLLERCAQEDIFTHAFLGDLTRIEDDLARDPTSAQAIDPAVDVLEITPVHHAVAAERIEVLQVLLAQSGERLIGGARAIREAAARASVAMVRLLLEHGADATSIGAGRWVLYPDLAALLSSAGARVDSSGAWIGLACTGNQGRKDDPEYVAALLRHGARVDDRRLVGQDAEGGRATALHYAAKAGFVRTIALLLQRGADPSARDDNGLTPLDWIERSAKTVDREAVRRLLRKPRRR